MYRRLLTISSTILLSSAKALAGDFPTFTEKVIDPNVGKVCYAVTVADVDGDKDQDIVALTENRVVWYEQPSWKAHVILQDQTPLDNVCIAPHDIDGDGQVDFAIGAGWTKTGTRQTSAKPLVVIPEPTGINCLSKIPARLLWSLP